MSTRAQIRSALLRRRDRWHARLAANGASASGAADRVRRIAAWGPYVALTVASYAVRAALWRPGRGGAADGRIEHIFVLVLENRSFDHMLGLSTGTVDPSGTVRHGCGIDAVTGAPTTVEGPAAQANSHADVVFPIRAGAPFAMPVDPPHEFCDVQLQLASTAITGKPHDDRCAYTGTYPPLTLDGFVDNYANEVAVKNDPSGLADLGAVMACFTPEQLPVLSTLASEFAVCDRWFSALPGPTWPNRLFLHAATSGGLDHSPGPLDVVGTHLDGYQFENGTIYDALDAKDLPWRVYAGDALPQVSALAGMDLPTTLAHFHHLDDLSAHLQRPDFSAAYTFIEPDYGHVLSHGCDFRGGNSQHPLGDVTDGEALVKYVYESIRRSPHWSSSLLVVTYDEHGGFYDHVAPPPAVPPGDRTDPDHNHHGFRFDQLGVRVPAVIVSPWIPRVRADDAPERNCNLIDHTAYDHCSLLATVERLYGLPPLTRRDAQANDFTHLLSAPAPRDAPWSLPEPAHSPAFDPTLDADGSPDAQTHVESRPITPALGGFLQTAAIQDARLSPHDHERVRRRAAELRTVGDARQYLSEVAGRLREHGVHIARRAPKQ